MPRSSCVQKKPERSTSKYYCLLTPSAQPGNDSWRPVRHTASRRSVVTLARLSALNKGCYPGQEVVARMDTYGNVRRHLVGLVLKDSVVPPHGAKLFTGDREVG